MRITSRRYKSEKFNFSIPIAHKEGKTRSVQTVDRTEIVWHFVNFECRLSFRAKLLSTSCLIIEILSHGAGCAQHLIRRCEECH